MTSAGTEEARPSITWLGASESSHLGFRFVGGRGIRTLSRVNMGGTEEVGVKDGKGMPVMLLSTLGSSGGVVMEIFLLKVALGNGNEI